MAQRTVNLPTGTENMQKNKAAKSDKLRLPVLERRPALGEIGNKITAAPPKKPTAKPDLVKKKSFEKKPSIEDPKPVPSQPKACEPQETIVDPDADSHDDPLMVTEYLSDVYSYLMKLELEFPIRHNFLDGHKTKRSMRLILVNWLAQVHSNFQLCLETLYMCVSLVDRYLQDHPDVGRDNLQLVGISALFIACKYEEIHYPEIGDFVYVCDYAFSKKQIFQMEVSILKALQFKLNRPISIHFLRRYNKIAQVSGDQHTLAKYILELALLDSNLSHIKPSMQAAAACFLSMIILTKATSPRKVWTKTLEHYTTYKYEDFKPIIGKFAAMLLVEKNSNNEFIRDKYAAAKYSKISTSSELKGPLVKKLAGLS